MEYVSFIILVAVGLYWLSGLLLWFLFPFIPDPRVSVALMGLVRPFIVFFSAPKVAAWLASMGVY